MPAEPLEFRNVRRERDQHRVRVFDPRRRRMVSLCRGVWPGQFQVRELESFVDASCNVARSDLVLANGDGCDLAHRSRLAPTVVNDTDDLAGTGGNCHTVASIIIHLPSHFSWRYTHFQ